MFLFAIKCCARELILLEVLCCISVYLQAMCHEKNLEVSLTFNCISVLYNMQVWMRELVGVRWNELKALIDWMTNECVNKHMMDMSGVLDFGQHLVSLSTVIKLL